MRTISHEEAAELHDRLLEGALDREGDDRLAGHRSACRACDADFAGAERLVAVLASLERPQPTAGFADRILAQLRPAPLPFWARWQISSVLGRAAVLAILLAGGGALLVAQAVVGPVLLDPETLALLYRWPGAVADALLFVAREINALRAPIEIARVVGTAVPKTLATPQVLLGAGLFGVLSALAFRQLAALVESNGNGSAQRVVRSHILIAF